MKHFKYIYFEKIILKKKISKKKMEKDLFIEYKLILNYHNCACVSPICEKEFNQFIEKNLKLITKYKAFIHLELLINKFGMKNNLLQVYINKKEVYLKLLFTELYTILLERYDLLEQTKQFTNYFHKIPPELLEIIFKYIKSAPQYKTLETCIKYYQKNDLN